ncbi:hypothetical protein [Persephonella sp.]|nr:FliO/MopB family protein [Aquificota bacterium]
MLEYSDILRMLSSLVIVIVLIYSIYYAITKFGRGVLPGQKGIIQIIDLKYLGKNRGLAVVKANGRYYFVSFDEKNLSIIEKWEKLEGESSREENEKDSDST